MVVPIFSSVSPTQDCIKSFLVSSRCPIILKHPVNIRLITIMKINLFIFLPPHNFRIYIYRIVEKDNNKSTKNKNKVTCIKNPRIKAGIFYDLRSKRYYIMPINEVTFSKYKLHEIISN